MSSASGTRSRLRRIICWPFTLWRERISAQMIASYIAMVLLVLILFEATVLVSILINPGDRFFSGRQVTIDPYLGERSGAFVQWLEPDHIKDVLNDEPLNRRRVEEVNTQLRQISSGNVPGFEGLSPVSDDGSARILIANTHGEIIFSSDPTIAAFTPIQDLPRVMRSTATRNQNLAGTADDRWNALYSLELDGERTIAAHPIMDDENNWIGTIIIESGAVSYALGQTRGEFFREISVVFLQSLWIFAIPAVIVAIPFGIWRANSISKRLERLADAAERMAKGELNTRVRIRHHDEIGRLAESFNTMAEQVHYNDRSRRAFLSNVSHELRTPVSIIMGNAEQMQMLPESRDESLAHPLRVIQHEGRMLVRLIDDLFTSARLQESNLRLNMVPVELAPTINSVISAVQTTAWKDRKVSVESLISPDLPPVLADAQRLQQIISNLVYNALRHTPEGGLVVAQAEVNDRHMQISISDTGLGMDEETAAGVFNRYYQSELNRRHGEGSGLGLHIVNQLVEAHGGRIWVTSKPGEGTTFAFTIPLAIQA